MASPHFANIIFEQAQKHGNRSVLFRRDDATAIWNPVSWNQFAHFTRQTALSLLATGVKPEDKIGIYSQNMPEVFYIDYAAFGLQAAMVPMFATASPEQVAYMINDAGIEIMFVGEQLQYDNVLKALPQTPSLKHIIVLDDKVSLQNNSIAIFYKDLLQKADPALESRYDQLRNAASPDMTAIIMYTSGTTGEPKGVVLPHSCFLEAMRIHDIALTTFVESDRSIAFLPLSHIFERAWCYYCLYRGARIYVNLRPQDIQTAIREVRPSLMCSVPRFWEKVFLGIKERVDNYTPFMKGLVVWAVEVGKEYNLNYLRLEKRPPLWLKIRYMLVDKLIFSKVKKTLGIENANFFPTAGAALEDKITVFLRSLGIPIIIGYGLTETTATVSCFRATRYEIGTVGFPMDGMQVRIGDDNEIQLKGKTIMQGYYKKPEASATAFTEDGWFKTGDAGKLDKTGNIILVERIKDLFKTSNGKYIAPQQIEMKLGTNKYIDQAAVIGDQRNYVTAIIVPALPELKKYAEQHQIPTGNIAQLLENSSVIEFYGNLIAELQKEMAPYEKIKKFTFIKQGFTIESGELTSTLKLRRAVIMQNYKKLIDEMYN
jgi:long-chain acyl-CoA synthetase